MDETLAWAFTLMERGCATNDHRLLGFGCGALYAALRRLGIARRPTCPRPRRTTGGAGRTRPWSPMRAPWTTTPSGSTGGWCRPIESPPGLTRRSPMFTPEMSPPEARWAITTALTRGTWWGGLVTHPNALAWTKRLQRRWYRLVGVVLAHKSRLDRRPGGVHPGERRATAPGRAGGARHDPAGHRRGPGGRGLVVVSYVVGGDAPWLMTGSTWTPSAPACGPTSWRTRRTTSSPTTTGRCPSPTSSPG